MKDNFGNAICEHGIPLTLACGQCKRETPIPSGTFTVISTTTNSSGTIIEIKEDIPELATEPQLKPNPNIQQLDLSKYDKPERSFKYKCKDKLEDIHDFIKRLPHKLFVRPWHRIQIMAHWFPVIWKDFDWDDEFLIDVLIHKLKRMEHLQLYHGNHVSVCQISEQMEYAYKALERLIEDDYAKDEWFVYRQKYPSWQDREVEEVDEQGRKRTVMKSMPEEQSKEFKRICAIDDAEKEKDKHRAFDTIRDYYDGWWD